MVVVACVVANFYLFVFVFIFIYFDNEWIVYWAWFVLIGIVKKKKNGICGNFDGK